MGQQVVRWNKPMPRKVEQRYDWLIYIGCLEIELFGKIMSDSLKDELAAIDAEYHSVIPVFKPWDPLPKPPRPPNPVRKQIV